jgi:hypothetical protein
VFYEVNYCLGETTVEKGKYFVSNDSLKLVFSGLLVTKSYNWEREFDKDLPEYSYHDDIWPTRTKQFALSLCDGKMFFSSEKLETVGIASEDSPENIDSTWDREKFMERLDYLEVKKGGILEGFQVYNPKLDTIILDKMHQILDTNFIDFDKTGKLKRNSLIGGYDEDSGKVVYAPDNSFKVFTFSGDGCGAHCNGAYYSVIQTQTGKFIETGFKEVYDILKTGENQYVIFQKSWSGGTAGRDYRILQNIRIKNDSFFSPVFHFKNPEIKKKYQLNEINGVTILTDFKLNGDGNKLIFSVPRERINSKFRVYIGKDGILYKLPGINLEGSYVFGLLRIDGNVVQHIHSELHLPK